MFICMMHFSYIYAYIMLAFFMTIIVYVFKCQHKTKELVGDTYVFAVMIYTFTIALKNVTISSKNNS